MGTVAHVYAKNRRQAGLTLLELLVAIAVMAIILGLGTPSFRDFLRNSRLTSVANDFLGALQLARTEAVKRQKPVSICPSANAGEGMPTCTSQADFSGGWIVFEDPDGTCRPDAATAPIRVSADIPPDEAAQLSARASGNCISYAETGYLRSVAGFTTADKVLVCDQRGIAPPGATQSIARGVEISPTGRAWITRDASIGSWAVSCPPAGT